MFARLGSHSRDGRTATPFAVHPPTPPVAEHLGSVASIGGERLGAERAGLERWSR
jgi:hypothetical protein